jgi:CDGSH-type Zn-finger protein
MNGKKEVKKTTKRGKGKIVVSKDGPYLVSGNVPLSVQRIVLKDGVPYAWEEDLLFDTPESFTLCRCGASGNKPACDGSHAKIEWNSEENATREPYMDRAEATEGPGLALSDVEDLCSYARFCHRDEGIWDLTEGSDDKEKRRVAIEIAGNCPSGRLVVWDTKLVKQIEPKFEPSIAVTDDELAGTTGPLWVRGGIPVTSSDGYQYEVRNRMTLCRCGRSESMPFCDGSHLEEANEREEREERPHS